MRMASRILFCLCLVASAARAASPEDAYLAARDKHISRIKAMEKAKASVEKADAEQNKAREDLETKLRGLLRDFEFQTMGELVADMESSRNSGNGLREIPLEQLQEIANNHAR